MLKKYAAKYIGYVFAGVIFQTSIVSDFCSLSQALSDAGPRCEARASAPHEYAPAVPQPRVDRTKGEGPLGSPGWARDKRLLDHCADGLLGCK